MAFLNRKQFLWNEPWFFQQRIRSKLSWLWFSLFLLGIGVVLGAALYWATPAGQPVDWFNVIGLSLALILFVWWGMDGSNTRRQAKLFEDSLEVGGDMGKYSSPTTYELKKISLAMIVMPAETDWPCPALVFFYKDEPQAIGIEAKTSLKRLAQTIHNSGVAIQMDGWHPDQESEIEKAFSWKANPQHVVEEAIMESLPPETVKLLPMSTMILAGIRQLWAIGLWFLFAIGMACWGYQNWNNLGVLQTVLLFAVPLGTHYLAIFFTERIGCASSSQGLVRAAKSQIRQRDGILVNPDMDDLIPVTIFERDQFEKKIPSSRDMGFLQADCSGQRMLYEGNHERWCIPVQSLRSVTLEEIQLNTPGQSTNNTFDYYVVVVFSSGEDLEFGFRYSKREYGKFNDVVRAQMGIRVYDAFEPLLSSN